MQSFTILCWTACAIAPVLAGQKTQIVAARLQKRSSPPAESRIVNARDYIGLVKKASGNATREMHSSGDSQEFVEKMAKWLTRAQGSIYRHAGIARMNERYYSDKLNRCENQAQLDRAFAKNASWSRLLQAEANFETQQLVDSAMSRYQSDAEQYRVLLTQAQALPASQAIQNDLYQRMQYASRAATMWERDDAEEAAALTKQELINYAQLATQGNGANDPQQRWRLVDSATKAVALHMRTQELYRLDEERQILVRLPGTKRRRGDDEY